MAALEGREIVAYTKIIPVRSRLDHCLDYVLDHEKNGLDRALGYIQDRDKDTLPGEFAGETCLETAINCALETACRDMMGTKRHYGKTRGVLAYHIIQSFAPGEVSAEEAHAVGLEFAQKLFGDQYEAVVSTHLNCEHYHNHILINSVSYADGRKYRNSFADYYGGIRAVSDQLCREHGLSVIEPEGHGQNYPVWEAGKEQPVRARVKRDVELAIAQADCFERFLQALEALGYTVKYGPRVKHIAVRPPFGERNIRLDSKGVDWPEDLIRERIEAAKHGEPVRPPDGPPTQTALPKSRLRVQDGSARRYRVPHGLPARRRKLHGFRALYVKYMFQLGIIPKRRPPTRAAFLMLKEEQKKLGRYIAQFKLFQQYRVDTPDQLAMLTDALQAEIDALTDRRRDYYRLRRRITALFSFSGGVVQNVMGHVGNLVGASVTVPEEIVSAIENVGFLESIPLWLVSFLGSLFITVMSFLLIMTVYGRFFKIYLFAALAPIPLSAFASEVTAGTGKAYAKGLIGVCIEGVVIVLACLVFTAFTQSGGPAVNTAADPVTMSWDYIAQTIFNMLILAGLVKGADRVVKEMFGL